MNKGTKKKLRVNKSKLNKLYEQKKDDLMEKYMPLSNEEIYTLSNKILMKTNKTDDDILTLDVLKYIIDSRG